MCESLEAAIATLQKFVEGFDPKALDREQSKQMVDKFVLVERLGAAGKVLTSLQAAETNVWWDGHRSPAHYMAAKSKCTVGRAVDIMDTAELMRRLPETEKAFRKGALSETQAIEVVSAAAMDVASQEELLQIAELESPAELHRQASRVRATAMDAEQKRARAHKRRRLTHWTDLEGVFHLDGRLTPELGAVVMACLQPFFQEIARKAAREGVALQRTLSINAPAPQAIEPSVKLGQVWL